MSDNTEKERETQAAEEAELEEKPSDTPQDTEEAIEAAPEEEQKDAAAAKAEEELKAWNDKYMRILAEYDNFKRRTAKEKTQIYTDAAAATIAELVPVLDNLQRATSVEIVSEDGKCLLEGVLMIQKQLIDCFGKLGVTEIEAVGKKIDPQVHNAVMHIEDEKYGENEIVEEFSKGYLLKDKVIRHSMVKVAN